MKVQNQDSGKDQSGNISKPLLSAVLLFDSEIDVFLKELFFEKWMDDEDWIEILNELEKQTGVSKSTLSEDLKIGVDNGHSLEKQFDLVRLVLKNSR
jgi:hypothetical protein